MKIRYFDHGATTPVSREVLEEMLPYFELQYGNASSMYSLGRSAKKALEQARRRVANAIGAKPKEIYFTSCGSESNNLAIKGIAYANKEKGNHIITSKIEHPAVLHTCQRLEKQGFSVTYLNVDQNGFVDLEQLKNSIKPTTILISIMFANNEIGTIQPIEQIASIAKKSGIIFHTDAVQAIGNIKIDVKQMQIDSLSLSGHKFYAPKGVGAVYIKEGIDFEKIQDGGHQENDKRAGTENVAQIVALGKAIEHIYEQYDEYNQKLTKLRDFYIQQVEEKFPKAKLNGDRKKRLPGNANFSFPNVNAQELLFALDQKGICASAGSACSTGSEAPSHVLTSIGLSKNLAYETLRTTFGKDNTMEDVAFLVESLTQIVPSLENK